MQVYKNGDGHTLIKAGRLSISIEETKDAVLIEVISGFVIKLSKAIDK